MSEYYVGLMSGTSMDALDAVLVDFTENPPRLAATLSRPLPPTLRARLLDLSSAADNEIERGALADQQLGRFSAETVEQLLESAAVASQRVKAIGSHGQTIRHAPDASPPYTVQIGDGNTIAQLTGITTIADFRRRDMVVGGQGAPLVPAFHNALYRDGRCERVILNIGGMANISILPADGGQPVRGFDTGPGNILLDSWCQLQQGEPFDVDGRWAASGQLNSELLQRLLNDPYFRLAPPKSTGREYFNHNWLEARLHHSLPTEDIQATLVELTVRSIAEAIHQYSPASEEVVVCGGGAYNGYLMQRLAANLSGVRVESSAAKGIEPRWIEAMAFAWLARRTLRQLPGNLPAVTGASEAVILGAIYPANPVS
ncbi:MAG: anhydro-N-acetylmuramic acid kinase [Gammaproteobacteria bacterium]|nr:anhydro-N-acetylmuramic acid kinase [Gammaproteobacteria bacterium]MCW8927631.1 anhydro-N-acetylmuramic acid kinase [Gammaproteobacteria bacterium]MCW8957633.1 anhydro-N-acetylmuramic acid kinase [Gammaproteobacteria bacterium]MCW8973004.1 anhydro-N-acetylmuramic acid kinase [Gammaproteobacteria bacterium]MCW8992949.1 anhydro-N-acetylmuramic acid kinase [Gammaproteobacteria bacterium]